MNINDHANAILQAAFPGATVDLLRDCWDNKRRAAILAAVHAVYEDGQVAMREECALTAAGSFNCLDAHDRSHALTSEQQL